MKVALGLGASIGARQEMLELALNKLHAHPRLYVVRCSRWYRTPPMRGGEARGWFLNGVAVLECGLELEELLGLCRDLELRADRRRSRHWGDRSLDLDILLAEGETRSDELLQVPHPGIASRPFVLWPLLEVWADATDAEGKPWAEYPMPPGPLPVAVGIMPRNRA